MRTHTVKIAERERINWTKNQENGTISIPTINLGIACLSSHVPSHRPIIFINAMTMRINANMKYTTFETNTQIILRYSCKPNIVPFTQPGLRKSVIKEVTKPISVAAIAINPLMMLTTWLLSSSLREVLSFANTLSVHTKKNTDMHKRI